MDSRRLQRMFNATSALFGVGLTREETEINKDFVHLYRFPAA